MSSSTYLGKRTSQSSGIDQQWTNERLAKFVDTSDKIEPLPTAPLIDMTHISVMVAQMGYDDFSGVVEKSIDELATRVAKMQRSMRSLKADDLDIQIGYMRALATLCGMSQLAYVLSRFTPDKIDDKGNVSASYIARLSAVADDSFRRIWDAPAFH